ncbi:MAG: hypothetical protein ACHQ50_13185 [Fimbriimonadales bacterium]
MTTTLYATFNDSSIAERAAGALLDYGAKPEDLSLVRQDSSTADAPPPDHVTELRHPGDWNCELNLESRAKVGITTTTPVDAEAGAIKGASLGAGVGAVAAIVSLFVPGFGFVMGGGALAVALVGLAGTTGAGAIAGAVTGYLKDQGMDWQMAEHLGGMVSEGGALLSILLPSGMVDEPIARSILDKYAAASVKSLAEQSSRGYLA